MGSLYKLVLKTNIKGPALAFPLIMPLVFILLYSTGMDKFESLSLLNAQVAAVFSTILMMITMQSGLMGFGINFITIKKSVLLRRIGATELSKMDVIIAMILFGLTLWIISLVWIFIVVVLFTVIGIFYSTGITSGDNVATLSWIKDVHWGKLILETIIMLYLSYSMGMLFTTIAPDDQAYMGMAMMYFFFAGFFGGIMLAGSTPEWMNYIGYIVPHRYVDYLTDWTSGKSVESWQLALGFVIPILIGTISIGGAAKLLKFD